MVLLVEDERDVRLVTSTFLQAHGYQVVEADAREAARRRLAMGPVDVVVLDLGLPDGDGLGLLADLRDGGMAVVIVSGRDSEHDRVVGLELGADDYLVKPFSQRELVARIHAVLRRQRRSTSCRVLRFGTLAIDTDARAVFVGGRPVGLARLEYDLLAFLAASPGRSHTHDQLLDAVWGSSVEWQSGRTLNEHVYRLRHKLALGDDGPRITTVRGVGYRFDP